MEIADIVANIDLRLTDLEAERAHLEQARSALSQQRSPAPKAKPRTSRSVKPRAPRRARSATSTQVAPAGKLFALLADSEGMSTRELAKAADGDPTQVLALLKEQEDAGQLRRSGVRASTRWHLVTDEDRIAARAAELAASSRHSRARKT